MSRGLDHACLERIAAACEWRHVDAKTPVFARSSTGNDVFFLLTGRVRFTSCYDLQALIAQAT